LSQIKLKSIELKGTTIIARYEKTLLIQTATPETIGYDNLKFAWQAGFDLVVFAWLGYAYARKKDNGKWHQIDLTTQTIQQEAENPFESKAFIYSKVVPEAEYGGWVNSVPIMRRSK